MRLRPPPTLSIVNTVKDSIRTRCVAVLAADGASAADIRQLRTALTREGARMEVVGKSLGPITCDDKSAVEADKSHLTAASVFYDAVFVPGGEASAMAMTKQGDAIHFVQEAFHHCKTLGANGEGIQLVAAATCRVSTSLRSDQIEDGESQGCGHLTRRHQADCSGVRRGDEAASLLRSRR